MFRRFFYAAAFVSAILLLATVILWPVSYYRSVDASYLSFNEYKIFRVGCRSGRLWSMHYSGAFSGEWDVDEGLHFQADELNPRIKETWSYVTWSAPGTGPTENPKASTTLGVYVERETGTPWTEFSLRFPLSYLTLLFAILPALAFRSYHRQRKAARTGICPKCGYDLRAHAPGSRCPECGDAVVKGSGSHASSCH